MTGANDVLHLGVILDAGAGLAALLRDARVGLQPGALVDLEFANAAHHRELRQLLRGDLDHRPRPAHLTYAGVFKAMLDAGFAPDIEAVVDERAGDDLLDAASPLLPRCRRR